MELEKRNLPGFSFPVENSNSLTANKIKWTPGNLIAYVEKLYPPFQISFDFKIINTHENTNGFSYNERAGLLYIGNAATTNWPAIDMWKDTTINQYVIRFILRSKSESPELNFNFNLQFDQLTIGNFHNMEFRIVHDFEKNDRVIAFYFDHQLIEKKNYGSDGDGDDKHLNEAGWLHHKVLVVSGKYPLQPKNASMR